MIKWKEFDRVEGVEKAGERWGGGVDGEIERLLAAFEVAAERARESLC